MPIDSTLANQGEDLRFQYFGFEYTIKSAIFLVEKAIEFKIEFHHVFALFDIFL